MQYDERATVWPASCAAGVVVLDPARRLLLIQKRKRGLEGLWHLPMGTVEPGESPEQTAVREAWEEAGLRVRLGRFLNAHLGRLPRGDLIVRLAWRAEPLPGQVVSPQFTHEIAEARYFSQAEFDRLYAERHIRMHHTKLFFEDALRTEGV